MLNVEGLEVLAAAAGVAAVVVEVGEVEAALLGADVENMDERAAAVGDADVVAIVEGNK